MRDRPLAAALRAGLTAQVRNAVAGCTRASVTSPGRAALAMATAAMLTAATTAALAASAGPQPASTGAPAIGAEAAEGTCVQCHNSFVVNPDADGVLTLEGVPDRYEPGKTYTLTMRLTHKDSTRLRWGFQMTAIAMKDGAGAGAFVTTDAATTQVLESMSGTRTYIEHSYGGTGIGQGGGLAWSFAWTAPKSDVGAVGFFAAANAANADGSNQGDRIYTPSPAALATSGGG
jgi:cytochrome c553